MSGVKKFMHKIKEKMESVGEGHHPDKDSHMEKVGGLVKSRTSTYLILLMNAAPSEDVLGTRLFDSPVMCCPSVQSLSQKLRVDEPTLAYFVCDFASWNASFERLRMAERGLLPSLGKGSSGRRTERAPLLDRLPSACNHRTPGLVWTRPELEQQARLRPVPKASESRRQFPRRATPPPSLATEQRR